MELRHTYPLKEFCKREHLPYEHIRKLAVEGLFPVTRFGRRVYVVEEVYIEWARRGGQALPGGWRRSPKGAEAGQGAEPSAAAPAMG